MKHTIMLFIIGFALPCLAQDYYYIYDAAAQKLDCPAGVQAINRRDKSGDWRDYRATKLPIPSVLPALVDASGGETAIVDGTIKQAIRAIQASQKSSVTNDATLPAKLLDALVMTTNTVALIGTNRTGFAQCRYDGTKLTAAQREQYQTECIQYLAARLQILERELRRRKLANITPIVEDEQ